MTRPPCVRLCPAYPGNPRNRIEGESPPQEKGHTVFAIAPYGLRPLDAQLRALRDVELRQPTGLPSVERPHHHVARRQRERTGVDLLRGIEDELRAGRDMAARIAHRRIDLQRHEDVVDDHGVASRIETGIQRPLDMTGI